MSRDHPPPSPGVIRRRGKTWLPVAMVTQQLGVTKERVYHLVWQKRIQSIRVNNLLYLLDVDVTKYKEYQKSRSLGDRAARSPRGLVSRETA